MIGFLAKTLAVFSAILAVAFAWSVISFALCPFGNINIKTGGDVFQETCASCHAVQAGASSMLGPNLYGIGQAAATRAEGMTAEAYLLESIVDPDRKLAPGEKQAMPDNVLNGYSRDAILSTVAYLMSQGGQVDYRKLAALRHDVKTAPATKPPRLDYVAAEAGRQLFIGKGQCHQCHRVKHLPDGNLRGPSLMGMGRYDAETIRQAIEDPNHFVAPAYQTHQVELASGRLVSGRRVHSIDDSIRLLTENDGRLNVVSITSSEIATDEDGKPVMHTLNTSPMPTPEQLTGEEIRLLVEFLRTL